MNKYGLGVVEARFADIIWQSEPITTADLIKKCQKELDWKRTTTYTVLKRLCERGIFRNDSGTVTAIISKEDFYSIQSQKFVDETFCGSLPAFVAAFASRKKLSDEEINQLQDIIENYRKEHQL